MANFFRLLLSILLLPMVYVFGAVLVNAVGIAYESSNLDYISVISFLSGGVLFILVWFYSPPCKLYVLGHELTHAIVAKFYGAKVSNLKVAAHGGSVMVSKTNMMITLSPYFFPFYTLLLSLVLGIVSLFLSPMPYIPLWFLIGGFTWFFHICFTVDSLTHHQPDIVEYGRFFSYVMIWFFNVFCVILFLIALTELSVKETCVLFFRHTADAYLFVYEFIRTLPFLQK